MKRAIVMVVAGVLSVGLTLPASAETADHLLFPPDAVARGQTLTEWQAAYQIWINEIPSPDNPQFHPDSPFNCARQPGRVVFLGGFGANCTIPQGAAVAFTPGLGYWECSTAEGHGATFPELRRCARGNFARDLGSDVYHQRVVFDGKRLRHQRRWVVMTPGEIIDFPADNIWGAVPGPSKSVTRGFMFVLRPLREGSHRIKWFLHHDVFGDFQAEWRLRVVDD